MTKDNKEIKKVFILAGGRGTRLSEQTNMIPKPLVEIDGVPVIVHVMRRFYEAGYEEFYLLCGYKVDYFKDFFRNYMLNGNNMVYSKYGFQPLDDSSNVEDWLVNVIDTGEDSTTGQRINSIKKYVKPGEPFFLTYGDSVSDVDVSKIEEKHFSFDDENVLTITATPLKERFGVLKVNKDSKVEKFSEKSDSDEQLINGGFIACNNSVLDYVNETSGDFSFEVLTKLAREGKMGYYKHDGFWHAMDTQKDVDDLTKLHKENPNLF